MADPQGVSFAPTSPTLGTADPTWVRLDTYQNLVAGWSVSRGRQDELSQTGTGTAIIRVNDTDGVLDPTNAGGPYFGNLNPLKQAACCLYNPVLSTWHTIFRGFVEEFATKVHESQVVQETEMSLVDLFEILGNIEVAPGGAFGQDPTPVGSEGDVFYDGTSGFGPQIRMEAILTAIGIPSAFWSINTGNVGLQPTVYPPQTSVLTILQDAADAEFPGIALLACRRDGVLKFTGRQVRFRPEVPAYDVDVWKAGDETAVIADAYGTAQIRGVVYSRPKAAIINAALAMPQEFREEIAAAHIQGQIVEDTTSIAAYGVRPWQADNLLTDSGSASGNDKWDETKLFATYYVDNYKDPQTRVTQIIFRSLPPDDPRAPWTWRVLCEVDINDIIRLTVDHPGGGGFVEEDFFVEGITYEVQPLNAGYEDVTLTLDVTPRANYTTNPFGDDPDPE